MGKIRKDDYLGDTNARHYSWDTTTSSKRMEFEKGERGNMHQVRAPVSRRYIYRGRWDSSNPNILLKNIQDKLIEGEIRGG